MNHFESVFDSVKSRNKIYCIEASAATHSVLPIIKKHIIKILQNQFNRGINTNFNILCFNSNVAKWCVTLVSCTEEHVSAAEDWLRHIQPEGSCNFLAALVSALREPISSGFCFIVTQHPNQELEEILDLIAFVGQKIECHIRLCILGSTIPDEVQNAQEVYSKIAKETNGTFAFVNIDKSNHLQIMYSIKNMLHLTDSDTLSSSTNSIDKENENLKKYENMRTVEKSQLFSGAPWSLTTKISELHDTGRLDKVNTYNPFDLWKRISASKSYLECMNNLHESNINNMMNVNNKMLAGSVIVGREVLARNYINGQYYIGYVKEQINNELFNVVFGPYDWIKGQYVATDYQKTKLLDLIDFNDALKHAVLPGDRVLAPDPTSHIKDIHLCRYLTGTVLHGTIIRDTYENEKGHDTSKSSEHVVVEFTHPLNKTEKILSHKVIHIPEPFFQRLCLEGAMPKSAREKLYNIPNYPLNSLPGYPTSGSKKNPLDFTFTNLNVLKSRTLQVDYLMPPYCLPLYPVVEIFEKDERTENIITKSDWDTGAVVKKSTIFKKDDMMVPESKYTVNELHMKVNDQIETFKDFITTKTSEDQMFFIKENDRYTEIKPSMINSRKSQNKVLMLPSFNNKKSEIKFDVYDNIILDKPVNDLFKKLNLKNSNFSIHEEYFDELKKIKETRRSLSDDTQSNTEDQREKLNDNKPVFQLRGRSSEKRKSNNLAKPIFTVINSSNITDLGQRDKEKESIEVTKLERRQRQIQKRLDDEIKKYCDGEMAKDKKMEFYRQQCAARIHNENIILKQEREAVDNTQSLKRAVLTEVENKIEPSQPSHSSYDDIDDKRIGYLKKRMESRNMEKQQRDQDAINYIEKLEESKRNRSDARWWQAQHQMLKEFPSDN